jgi:PAS domain S-box-containing protein
MKKDVTEKLRHVLESLSALSDGIEEPVYVIDPDKYEVLFANKKAKEIFGEDIIGKKCYVIFENLNHPCSSCNNKYVLGENIGKTHTSDYQDKKTERWYKVTCKAIKWLENKHVKYGIAIDITEQKKIEEALKSSEELFRSIVENSHNVILLIDENFKIIYANNEAVSLSGYPKEEIIGQDFRKFLDEESRILVEERYIRRQKGEHILPRYQFKIVRKDGEKRDVELKATVIRDKFGKVRSIAQLLDITERKKIENERKRFEESLSTLNNYGQSLNMAKNMEEIYKLTLDAMEKTLGFEFADIFIIEGKMLCLKAHRGYSKDLSLKLPLDGDRGVTVKAARTKKSIFIPDVSKEKAFVGEGAEGVRSELAVPMKVGNKVLGVLNVENRKLSAFDKEDRKLLEILASHAAIAISNLKRQERLSALNEYGRNLNMAKDMNEIYKLTLDAMKKTLGFEYASILMIKGKTLCMVAYRGYSKIPSLKLPLDGKKGITVRVVRTSRSIFVPDVTKQKAYVKGGEGIRSELAVPINVGNNAIGVLNVESKKIAAFDEEDKKLLETLASHAATAISNLKRREKLMALSQKITNLMKSSTEIMHVKDMHQRLKVIAKAIQNFGWRRVVISLRDEKLEGIDLVTSGLTKEETKLLLERKAPGHVWRERLGPKFERFKIGEFYYLPWSDPWIREYVHHVPHGTSPDVATTYAGVPSRLSPEEMVDWHPQDMLYAALRTPEGRIVGILSMDDPIDGRKPTRESLMPLELFLHQAAITIENAQLIESLRDARKQLETYALQLEQKVEERTRELKKSQEELLKAQRLAVIGELAGMVGHDLRNPLTSIAGAQYYLKKRLSLEANDKIKDMLDLIERNITYSNKIINDLLDYSREIELEISEVAPKSLVKEALTLVEIPKNVRVLDLTKNKPKIRVDAEKIRRIFVNMIKNAVEAMPKGGKITIKSRKIGENLEMIFSDTGVGMSKKTLEKLWTPLFTTKARGMGFGLAVCKRFVEAHGGSISVKSAPGKGTTFTVTIPIQPKIKKEGGEKIWMKPLESSLLTTTKT